MSIFDFLQARSPRSRAPLLTCVPKQRPGLLAQVDLDHAKTVMQENTPAVAINLRLPPLLSMIVEDVNSFIQKKYDCRSSASADNNM
mmetsp:Transcript_20034/g.30334  ORF Transcript_20034/g.30334 Transcript_20034/m.30334 type:complete len:87 (-) Transcript_20034:1160-1420(-)